jgi:hypothetical protein
VTHQRERYQTLLDMAVASALRASSGWGLVQAARGPDGSFEVVYER